MRHYLLLALFLYGSLHAQQQPHDFDYSFGSKGLAMLQLKKGNVSSETGLDVFVQHNGKYIVVMEVNEYTVLARYHPNGALDKSFGKAGYSDAVNVLGVHAVQQPDGKVIVAGQALNIVNQRYAFGIARFTREGKLDPSFGTRGMVITNFGLYGKAFALALQNDGKIVAAGFEDPDGSNENFALIRYNRNGSLDLSFGIDGKVSLDIGQNDNVSSIAIQNDGKIVAAGYSSDINFNYDFVIVRYNPNGSRDNTFGNQGIVVTDFFGRSDQAESVAIQNDGKIVVGGLASNSNGNAQFALARYNPNGSLDNSFDGDGKLITEFDAGRSSIASIKLEADGRIVAAGVADDFALARYLPDGSLDNSFDLDGKLTTDFGGQDFALSVEYHENGKIIVIGQAFYGVQGSDFALARYNPDGSLDNSFDTDGKLTGYYPGQSNSQFRAVTLRKNEKILAAGELLNPLTGNYDFVVAQFDLDGNADPAFGYGGHISTDFGYNDYAYSIAVQKDGKILVGGTSFNDAGNAHQVLARYLPNGRPDNSFGDNGNLVDSFSGNYIMNSIIVQKNGRIVVSVEGGGDFALLGYTANGSPDPGFGNGGRVFTDFGQYDVVNSLAIQQDGKIVAAGYTSSDSGADFALARYNSDGNLDNSFGNGGKITSDFGMFEEAFSVAIQKDGKIIAAGSTHNNSVFNFDYVVARYDRNGNPDNSFGNGGHIITNLTEIDQLYSVSLQKDGKILVAGFAGGDSDNLDFGVVRYKSDGQPDESFGNDGTLVSDIGASDHAYASVWADDRFYVAGGSLLATGWTAIIVAYKARANDHDYPWYHEVNGMAMDLSTPAKSLTLSDGQKLTVSVQPNPSALSFRLQLQGNGTSTVAITVLDNTGRVVETRSGIPDNSIQELGQNYIPGIYYAQVIQGKERMTLKLLKTSR